ncbi:MAG: hypothetical protein U0234_01155 [Sandaracinus sp.]
MARSNAPLRGSRSAAASSFLAPAVALVLGCIEMPRERVASLPDRGYPACEEGAAPATQASVSRELRAGPVMTEQSVVESFSLEARGCHVVYTGHEEWAMGSTDLEIVYDATRRPLRVYMRSTAPGPQAPAARTDVRVYDFRGAHVELTRRAPLAEIERLQYRAPTPGVVIATGRGALTPWIQRAHLAVGEQVREPVLDIRERVEIIRDVTLRREEDRDDSRIGHVRVYTIYGREPVYTDDADVVIGDMMGLVPAALVTRERDPVVPTDGPPSPRAPFGP